MEGDNQYLCEDLGMKVLLLLVKLSHNEDQTCEGKEQTWDENIAYTLG